MMIHHDGDSHSIARITGGIDYLLRLTLSTQPRAVAVTTLRLPADSDAHFQANEAVAAAVRAAVAEGLTASADATGHQVHIKAIAYHQTGRDPAAAVATFRELTIALLQDLLEQRKA